MHAGSPYVDNVSLVTCIFSKLCSEIRVISRSEESSLSLILYSHFLLGLLCSAVASLGGGGSTCELPGVKLQISRSVCVNN